MTRRPDDIEVYRAASTLAKHWGEDAPLEAARNADVMIERGVPDGLVFWKRVIEAMKDSGFLLSTEGPHHNVLKLKPPLT